MKYLPTQLTTPVKIKKKKKELTGIDWQKFNMYIINMKVKHLLSVTHAFSSIMEIGEELYLSLFFSFLLIHDHVGIIVHIKLASASGLTNNKLITKK